MNRYERVRAGFIVASLCVTSTVAAEIPVDDTPPLPVVSVEANANADTGPARSDTIRVEVAARAKPVTGLSDVVAGIPGVLARDRQNSAQDEQISIRGFGARATFGVRGIRVYTDGVPASMPDGQGQVSHASLDSAARVRVLRGPYSALFGNASGGVITIDSLDGSEEPGADASASADSDGGFQLTAATRSGTRAANYNVALSRLQVDGNRAHSAARREQINGKLVLARSDRTRLVFVANGLAIPEAQDPLGLTQAQWRADPHGVASVAETFNTRKAVHQAQAGAVLSHDVDAQDDWRLMAYTGQRDVRQFLSIPVAAQTSPTSAGGVVDLNGRYAGIDARWTHRGALFDAPSELTAGVAFDTQNQHRRGYENFRGDQLGVVGNLRRDEVGRVHSTDLYAQWAWRVAPRWLLLAGARHSRVKFRVDDDFITASNPDDSGQVDYSATTPVAGLQTDITSTLRAHASVGRGFETPTFGELGYRADGQSGVALNLRPARSRNGEIGLDWAPGHGLALQATAFISNSRDELAVFSNVGGRSTFQNIDRTRRRGLEFAAQQTFAADWHWRAAYTHLRAEFRSDFLVCTSAPCAAPTLPIPAGNAFPGVPRNFGSLRVENAAAHGWSGGVDAEGASATAANDAGSVHAPGYAILGADLSYSFASARIPWRLRLRIDNASNRRYVGSVIVNEGNARYFEPGPDRTWFVTLALGER